METELNKLNVSDKDTDTVNTKNCSYCNKAFTEELWCRRCDPFKKMGGWTSGNPDIDKFIKDTMHEAQYDPVVRRNVFLGWVPFDRLADIIEIGEGGFSKVYSATWLDGYSYYANSHEKRQPVPIQVALKRLNGSQIMSDNYLNELKIHWGISISYGLKFYAMTKDPETNEFMMIMQFANKGSLRSILTNNFNNTLWNNKLKLLRDSANDLYKLHRSGYFHKDFHSGNILRVTDELSFVSDFGLSRPANEQNPDNKVYGKLAYKCMSANPNERPSANELFNIFKFWLISVVEYRCKEEFGYNAKEIKEAFEKADEEIPNISTSYEKNSNAIYTSRKFSKPVNSSNTTNSKESDQDCDSQMIKSIRYLTLLKNFLQLNVN
ncbi:kinase-like domain-containing protein [Rhizophagus irregularis DAOM 181602=DAOM 197198]|nr:kinase-like domain-containing protein [Rhizophagus irregularis DAOM 181602=DAOM 197198]